MQKRDAYTFETDMLELGDTEELENQSQCVHFTISDPDLVETIVQTIERWYADFDMVVLTDQGTTGRGLGFIVLEWEGCGIDPEFIEVLVNDDNVDDYSIYVREYEVLEEEEV